MSIKLRSGKVLDQNMDELSGLFSKTMKFSTPSSKRGKKSDDDILTGMFGKLSLSKSIGKSRRKGPRYTYRKKHGKTPANTEMELSGGKRSRSRRSRSKRSRSKRSRSKRSRSKRSRSKRIRQ